MLADITHQGLDFHADFRAFLVAEHLNVGQHKRLLLGKAGDFSLVNRLDQHLESAIWQLQGAHHHTDHAGMVNILNPRRIDRGIFLGHQHNQLVPTHRLINRPHRRETTNKERQNHVAKHHHVSNRHHRQIGGNITLIDLTAGIKFTTDIIFDLHQISSP